VLGAVYGSVAGRRDLLVDSPDLREIFERLGGSARIIDAYLGGVMGIVALIAAAYGIQAALRLRVEEENLRAEPVLATAVPRSRWMASHLMFAFGGPVVALAVAGLTTGLTYGAIAGDLAGQVPRVLAAALVQVPAVWVMVAVGAALFGLLPRLTGLAGRSMQRCRSSGFSAWCSSWANGDRPVAVHARAQAPGATFTWSRCCGCWRSPSCWPLRGSAGSAGATSTEAVRRLSLQRGERVGQRVEHRRVIGRRQVDDDVVCPGVPVLRADVGCLAGGGVAHLRRRLDCSRVTPEVGAVRLQHAEQTPEFPGFAARVVPLVGPPSGRPQRAPFALATDHQWRAGDLAGLGLAPGVAELVVATFEVRHLLGEEEVDDLERLASEPLTERWENHPVSVVLLLV
jgi:hypothetical protein